MASATLDRADWREAISPRLQDIIGDFAGRELCAIHGEALLLHCLAAAGVDFHGGFQLLHAVHAVESFLSKLQARGCHFHVLWFDDHEVLLRPPPQDAAAAASPEDRYAGATAFAKRRLARAVLMQHLERHAATATPPTVLGFRFPSMHSEAFEAYRQKEHVRLFFASDGHTSATANARLSGAAAADGGRQAFEDLLYHLTTTGFTVALLDDVKFQSSEIRATLYSATPGIAPLPASYRLPPLPAAVCGVDAARLLSDKAAITEAAAAAGLAPLTSRDLASTVVLAHLLRQDPSPEVQRRSAAVLAQHAVVRFSALPDRPVEPYACADAGAAALDSRFVNLFCCTATCLLNTLGPSAEPWDTYDLIDGRLWSFILRHMDTAALAPQPWATFEALASLVSVACGVDLSGFVKHSGSHSPDSAKSALASASGVKPLAPLLPFHQPDFDPLLKGVATAVCPADESAHANPRPHGKRAHETTHWHSTKSLSTLHGQERPADARAAFRKNRANQRRMAEMIDYAASLTNAVGKVLEPEVIVTAATKSSGPVPSSQNRMPVRSKPNKVPTRKDLMLEAAQSRATAGQNAALDKASRGWAAAFESAQRLQDALQRYLFLADYVKKLSPTEKSLVGPDALLSICCLLGRLLASGDSSVKSIGTDITALVWVHMQEFQQLPLSGSLKQAVEKLASVLDLAVDLTATPSTDCLLSHEQPFLSKPAFKALVEELKHGKWALAQKPAEFQLEKCGPYMERGFDSQPDARVANFSPDAWQRKVLDTIDKRQSLFTVAPTSAGKTFISFYAMKQVLKESNDGVLVYIAPTKAICNQVAADVQARFSKSYTAQSIGRFVWGIKTRDTSINNPTSCQILVTVPDMLQILLLSPSSSTEKSKHNWPSRIKWIIFDEVHSIGQSEEGVVWEQLLLMAPCPIIALSATVGNPADFMNWLAGCERAKGREIEMVAHASRYSDLRCHIWSPRAADFRFDGFDPVVRWPIPGLEAGDHDQNGPFTFLHPVASLMDRSRDSLDDVSLEARDCFTLWTSMNRHQTEQFPVGAHLDPNRFFRATIAKADVVQWEAALKALLLQWMRRPDSPFLAVQKDLAPAADKEMAPAHYQRVGTASALELLVDLQARGALPALLFLYDRTGCMTAVEEIVGQLQASEARWKETSPVWAKKMAAWEKHREQQESADRKAAKGAKGTAKAPKKAKKRRGDEDGDGDGDGDGDQTSKLEGLRRSGMQEGSKWDGFDPEAPLDSFSFANYHKVTRAEVDEVLWKLRYCQLSAPVLEALRRGVAVHHAGMNRRYRQAVEVLFRRGFLTVVVATGTLALGINMPCKTVVFLGDSNYLTALNYRQAAGRAGRRGFDILGNVVFYGFTLQRAKELMSSRLSDLRGHFPVSTSLVLRTSMLLYLTKRCAFAQASVKALFSQTRFFLGGPEGKEAIKHHLRFSLEFLRRNDLLSAEGGPLDFSELVSHLYYTESSAFAFHALFRAGYFHRLCARLHENEKDVLTTLVLVLAHIFQRLPCRQYKNTEWLEKTVRPSSSVVLLPPLPVEAESILRAHNAGTLATFQTYAQSYVQQHLAGQPDDTLPFTNQRIGPGPGPPQRGAPLTTGGSTARPAPVELRSPFAALSGFTDEFATVSELCGSVRAGVFLEAASVPFLAVYPADTDGMPFNAYLYDFFRHGDQHALASGNGIRESDAWYVLQNFSLTLACIVVSLKNFVDPSGNWDEDDGGLSNNEDGDDGGDGGDGDDAAGAVGGDDEQRAPGAKQPVAEEKKKEATATATATKGKKKAVLESWDDGDSDSGSDAASAAQASAKTAAEPAWSAASPESTETVLLAFSKLKTQFDDKFHMIWA